MNDRENYWTTKARGLRATRRRFIGTTGTFVAGAAALASVGCGDDDDDDEAASPSAPGTTGATGTSTATTPAGSPTSTAPKGTIRFAIGDQPENYSGIRQSGGASYFFTVNVFEGLTSVDAEGKLVPAAATEWEVAPDFSKVSFTLRDGMTFHNGDPVTTEDVIYSIDTYRQISVFKGNLRFIDKMESPDAKTVVISLTQPDARLLTSGIAPIEPKKYTAEVGDDGFQKKPVGSGPYKVRSITPGEGWVLDAHAGHWRNPTFAEAIYKVVPEAQSRVAAVQAGETDVAYNLPYLQGDALSNDKNIEVVKHNPWENIYFNLNPGDAKLPLGDVRVRRAILLSLDRETIVKSLFRGNAAVAGALVQEGVMGYDPAIKPHTRNLTEAKALLSAAGFADGFDLQVNGLVGGRSPQSQQVGEAAAEMLKEAGIRTKVNNLEYGIWINTVRPTTEPVLDGVIFQLWSDAAPGDPANRILGSVATGGAYSYQSGQLGDRFKQIAEDNVKLRTTEERSDHMRQAFKLLYDEVPIIPLYHPYLLHGVRKDKVTWKPIPGYTYLVPWTGRAL
ncbi:MAG: ABC transporter substrate-binding protein [Dehalococcoidia bacterium]|nr:ABC transporter substrate-binding protein [Dehalococcoidia bacterium]